MAPELSEVLQDFRKDLDAFFKAQKKHNSTRQRLQDVYLRLLDKTSAGSASGVGIAGIGKSSESPNSKGSKAKRQAISLQELGGEALIRELLAAYLAEQRGVTKAELQQSMQDVWVDEVSDTSARVSVLFSKPKPECTQLALHRDGTRWRVAKADEESLPSVGHVALEGCLLQAAASQASEIQAASVPERPNAPVKALVEVDPATKLVGKSPLFRPKDVTKLFDEIDADGDGQLSKEDLLSYLRDYLGYGHIEVLHFLEAYRGQSSGLELADFKKGLKELNPYAVYNRDHQLIVRKPHSFGGIEGVDFHLEDCTGCTCLICDKSEEFKVDALKTCRVLIGPCSSSTFIRNCENCTFWVATKQFRVRDCSNCTFYLHSHTEPVIEASKDLRIAPFHATYPGLQQQFRDAGFDPKLNFWNAVYDFTGNSKSANWSIPPLDECEKLVVTFEGSEELPEAATPELTQELLLADPLESSESHGQSVSSVPQTRPPAPRRPSPKRLRRCISDATQEVTGLLEAVMLSERQAATAPKEVRAVPKTLVGKSPLFRCKDVAKLFEEMDADADGQLSKEDLVPFLRDYLGYGHAEVLGFLEAYRGQKNGLALADFKKGLKDLNPYAIYNRENQLLVRKPHSFGGIDGVDFHLEDCTGCTCLICDKSEEFKVDALNTCFVLIGPCSSSTFIRNCENCTFWVATKQFRVRDCSNCTFYLHCHTEPVIEASKDLRIAPFHATYPGLKKQFQDAGFDPKLNFWNAVYDFTGNNKHANWSIVPLDECEKLVVTFEGSEAVPEAATPEISQEILLADPLESSESHGQSVSSVPQTRPPAPRAPSQKRFLRSISDSAKEIKGILETVESGTTKVSQVEIPKEVERVTPPEDAPGLGGSSKASAVRSMPGEGANRSRPLGGLRLTSGAAPGAAPEPEAEPKRCKNCNNTGIHFLGKTCTCPIGKKILNGDSSDEDMIFAPKAAKGSSGAAKASSDARQKIGEKIGVLMSSLDSDEENGDSPTPALTERQRKLMAEGLAGLGMPRISQGEFTQPSSSEDEIIVKDEAKPKAKARAAPGSESSESDDDVFMRWKSKAPAARSAAMSD